MNKLNSKELRQKFLDFFAGKNHKVISSASLIPENDPTVLFTTAGMHPLVPYLLGAKHPEGKRLCNVQKCVRTGDIDDVGDNTHCTFFEMLGNWSLGDYFKEDAIKWSFEFLTSEKYLNIPINMLAVSVFEGDSDAQKDEYSAKIWSECGIESDKIFYLPKKNNWWGPAGLTGPCGPDTEIFIDTKKEKCSDNCSPACDCGKYIEIWNNVFMEYNKLPDGKFEPLAQKNVDTGMGLERTVCILNGFDNVYKTDLFKPAIELIEDLCGKKYLTNEKVAKAVRIIADHIRTATFMIGDQKGVTCSNVDQGYVLRRLIRRALRYGWQIELKENSLSKISRYYIDSYCSIYPELKTNEQKITEEISREESRFSKTISLGLKEFEKVVNSVKDGIIDGFSAFRLYDTYGFPIELTCELAKEKNLNVDVEGFKSAFSEHQQKSSAGSEQRFKGGLADNSDEVSKLHTATHLLHKALRNVLGSEVAQKGSNITAERLRFDFSFNRPMTEEEVKKVEKIVNDVIKAGGKVVCEEMTFSEAKACGAIGLFEDKYGEKVKVYTIADFSKEVCGGPHAESLDSLGKFVIQKEQSSSAGVRRIKAVLE
ncbi:MAG: alanine--tRNA ligase [Firmicutes bacterium]|nr:alanine--tRNA ligase [Bacillota bacterium]